MEQRSTATRDVGGDVDIAARLRAGDIGALREVYDREALRLAHVARLILGSASDAEDVVHDLFVALMRRPERYDPERGRLTSWLTMSCRSLAIDRLRSRSARELRDRRASPAESVHDEYATVHPSAAIAPALRLLDPSLLRLVELTFFDGLTYEAAANVLGIPVGTAKSRMRRALTTLRCDPVLQAAR